MNTLNLKDNLFIQKVISLALTVMVCIGLIASCTANVSADTLAYEMVRYEVNTTVFDDHSYSVEEKITVRMPEDAKTLDVSLPSGNYQVTDVNVKGVSYLVTKSNRGRVLTINDPDKLKHGKHTFVITYTIKEFAERTEENDIFYYDALLPEWRVPIGEIAISVKFPRDFPWDDIQYYAGQFGMAKNTAKLNYKADEASRTVTITAEKIPENFSVTLKAQLPDGYWRDPVDHTWAGYAIPGALLAALLLSALLWLIGGRDPKIAKTKEKYPIDGIAPSDITYIYEGKVKVRDIISLIIYMGTKGYLKISEYAPKKYRLVKIAEPKGEERFIRSAYNTLFEGVYDNRSIDMDELGPRLRRAIKQLVYDVEAGYADKSMASKTTLSRVFRVACVILISAAVALIPVFTAIYNYVDIDYSKSLLFGTLSVIALISICRRSDSKYDVDATHYHVGMTLSLLLFAVAVCAPLYQFIFHSRMYLPAIAAVIIAAGSVFFCIIMTARGKGNAELAMRLNQLRKFIYRAKWTDVEDIYRENPDYYYDMFPYALIFSGLETWAKTFKYLDVDAPEWFSDDVEGHAESTLRSRPTSIDYAKDIKSFARTMEDSYNAMIRHHRRDRRK